MGSNDSYFKLMKKESAQSVYSVRSYAVTNVKQM